MCSAPQWSLLRRCLESSSHRAALSQTVGVHWGRAERGPYPPRAPARPTPGNPVCTRVRCRSGQRTACGRSWTDPLPSAALVSSLWACVLIEPRASEDTEEADLTLLLGTSSENPSGEQFNTRCWVTPRSDKSAPRYLPRRQESAVTQTLGHTRPQQLGLRRTELVEAVPVAFTGRRAAWRSRHRRDTTQHHAATAWRKHRNNHRE